MLYLRAAFWLITFVSVSINYSAKSKPTIFLLQIFDHLIKHHHENLRLKGYHDFYRATSVHKGIPLYIVNWTLSEQTVNMRFITFFLKVSLWNTTIMAIQTLIQHYYGKDFGFHCVQVMLSPVVYITLFSCVETILLIAVHGSYISEYFLIIFNFYILLQIKRFIIFLMSWHTHAM